jgi:hypothetical protein
VGFVVSLPFQTSSLGGDLAASTGLPINWIAANWLHYADLAYVVGFAVAYAIFWAGARSTVSEMETARTTA